MKSLHTSRNTAHSGCKPSTSMSLSTHSFQVLLFLPLYLAPATSTFLLADTQSSTLLPSRCPNHYIFVTQIESCWSLKIIAMPLDVGCANFSHWFSRNCIYVHICFLAQSNRAREHCLEIEKQVVPNNSLNNMLLAEPLTIGKICLSMLWLPRVWSCLKCMLDKTYYLHGRTIVL